MACYLKLNRTMTVQLNKLLRDVKVDDPNPLGVKGVSLTKILTRDADGRILIDDQDPLVAGKLLETLSTYLLSLGTEKSFYVTKIEDGIYQSTLDTNALNEYINEVLEEAGDNPKIELIVQGTKTVSLKRMYKRIAEIEKSTDSPEIKQASTVVALREIERLINDLKEYQANPKRLATEQAKYEKLKMQFPEVTLTDTSFKIPAYMQIHYSTGLFEDQNMFLLEDADGINMIDAEQKKITQDIINALIETKHPTILKAVRFKDSRGELAYKTQTYDHTQGKFVDLDINYRGTPKNTFYDNEKNNEVYVMDSSRMESLSSRRDLPAENYLNVNDTNFHNKIQNSGKDNSNELSKLKPGEQRVKTSVNFSVASNSLMSQWIEVYNQINPTTPISTSLAYTQGRLEQLKAKSFTSQKIVKKKDSNGKVTWEREAVNTPVFVTKSPTSEIDIYMTVSRRITNASGVEVDIEEVSDEGNTFNYIRVMSGEGDVITTEDVKIDEFFDKSGKFLEDKFETFVNEYFTVKYDANNDLHNRVLAALPIEALEQLSELYPTGTKNTPEFIPFKLVKEALYDEREGNFDNNELYHSFLRPFTYNLFQAKFAKSLIDQSKGGSLTLSEFHEGVMTYAESLGYNGISGNNNKPYFKFFPPSVTNEQTLSDTEIGLVAFELYKQNGKIIDSTKLSEEQIQDGIQDGSIEVINGSTSFYLALNNGKQEIVLGEVLDDKNNSLNKTEVAIITKYALSKLREKLNLTEDEDLINSIVGNTTNTKLPNNWRVSPNTETVLLIPQGRYLFPARVVAKKIKGDQREVATTLNEMMDSVDLQDFKRKSSQFEALAPFMFLYHINPALFAAARWLKHTELQNILNSDYKIKIKRSDGNEAELSPIEYMNAILFNIDRDTLIENKGQDKIDEWVKEYENEDTKNALIGWMSSIEVQNDNLDLSLDSLQPFYDEAVGERDKKKNVDDIPVVTNFTSRVLERANSGITVVGYTKGGEEVKSSDFVKGFTNNYVSIITENLLPETQINRQVALKGSKFIPTTEVGSMVFVIMEGLKQLRKEGLDNDSSYDFAKVIAKKDLKNVTLSELNSLINSGVYETLRVKANEYLNNFSSPKLGILTSKNNLESLWGYERKIAILNLNLKKDKDLNNDDTNRIIPFKLSYHNGKVIFTGDLRFFKFENGKFSFKRQSENVERLKFALDKFDPNNFTYEDLIKNIVSSIVSRKLTYAESVEKGKVKKDGETAKLSEFQESILKDEGKALTDFLTGFFNKNLDTKHDVKFIENIPSSYLSNKGVEGGISRSKLVTKIDASKPISIVTGYNSSAIEFYPTQHYGQTQEQIDKDKESAENIKVISETLTDDDINQDLYIQGSNEEFKNDYEISQEEINNFIRDILGGNLKVEDFNSEVIQNLIARARIQGTPLGVVYGDLISLATNSAGIFYHEAFHRVFNSLLYPSERNEILEEFGKKVLVTEDMLERFRDERGFQDKSDSYIRSKFLEEKLADMFGQYKVDTKDRKKSLWRRMLGDTIVDLFEDFLRFIKVIKSDPVKELFKRIDNGTYANRISVPIEKPHFSIIQFQNDGLDQFALERKQLLKDYLVSAKSRDLVGTELEEDVKKRVLENTIIHLDNILNLYTNADGRNKDIFRKFSETDMSILQDMLLLPIYVNNTTQEYIDKLSRFRIAVVAIDTEKKLTRNANYFYKIHTFLSKTTNKKDPNWYNNTSNDTIKTLYEEIKSLELVKNQEELSPNLQPNEDGGNEDGRQVEQLPQEQSRSFDERPEMVDPSKKMSRFIKSLISGYSADRRIPMGNGEFTIPVSLDSLTVYNTLLKMYANKDLKNNSFHNNIRSFLDNLDFFTKIKLNATNDSEYVNMRDFREFIYDHFDIETTGTPLVNEEEGRATRTLSTRSKDDIKNWISKASEGRKAEMLKFLDAFSNNIIDYGIINIKPGVENNHNYYMNWSVKADVIDNLLTSISNNRKKFKEGLDEETKENIKKIVAVANGTLSIEEKTKEIKDLLYKIKVPFSTEYIFYSLAKQSNDTKYFEFFTGEHAPIMFTEDYFNTIFGLVSSQIAGKDIHSDDPEGKNKKEIEKLRLKTDVKSSLYASAWFDPLLSTLVVRSVDKKSRYLLTKDFHVANTFKNRKIMLADGLIETTDNKTKVEISDTTGLEYYKYLMGAMWGQNDLGEDIGFFCLGQMETTLTKMFVSGKLTNWASDTGDPDSTAIDTLYSTVNKELSLFSSWVADIKKQDSKKRYKGGIDSYSQPIFDENGKINWEDTLSKNKLGGLFETATLMSKEDHAKLVKLIHDKVKAEENIVLTKDDILEVKNYITSYVKDLAKSEEEFRNKNKVSVPYQYLNGFGAVVQVEDLNKHISMNSVLNSMIEGTIILKSIYGEFGSSFKDMESDYLKRGKALAAIGHSFTAHNAALIEDDAKILVFFEHKTDFLQGFTAEGETVDDVITDINNHIKILNDKYKTTHLQINNEQRTTILSAKNPVRALEAVLKTYSIPTRVAELEATDGESHVSVVHRIQQLHDLARTDEKLEPLLVYMLSEGLLWMDKGNIVEYDAALHVKDYMKVVTYSMETNANFAKFKTVATYKTNTTIGKTKIESFDYTKESESVLAGALVRELSKDADKQLVIDTFKQIYANMNDTSKTMDQRFMSYGKLYKSIENEFVPIHGYEKLYEKFRYMVNNDISHLVYASASKTSKVVNRNLTDTPVIRKVPNGGKLLQQEVPNWKEEALSGTQMLELILADQNDEVQVFVEGKLQSIKDIKEQFLKNLTDMFLITKNEILESLGIYVSENGYTGTDGKPNTKIDEAKLGEILRRSAKNSGKDDFAVHNFMTNADGEFINHIDAPAKMFDLINTLTSFFNKPYKLKKNAESYAIISSRMWKVAEKDGKIVSRKNTNKHNKEDLTFRDLKAFKTTRIIDGKSYNVEIHECVVGTTRGYEHLLMNQELTEEELYASLPMDSPLREMLGYRIPTEDKRSIKIFKIVDFLPPEYGSSIITTDQSMLEDGHDMDIDKQFTEKPYEMRTPKGFFNTIDDKEIEFNVIGANYQIGYHYTEEDLLKLSGVGLSSDDIKRFNEELLQHAKDRLIQAEVNKRKDYFIKDEIQETLKKIKVAQDNKDSKTEVELLRKYNKIAMYDQFQRDAFEGMLLSLSDTFEQGMLVSRLIDIIGQEEYDKIENDLKPYIVKQRRFDYIVTKKLSLTQDKTQTKVFANLVGLILRASIDKDTNEILQEFDDTVGVFNAEFYNEVNQVKEEIREIEKPLRDIVERSQLHMFPIYGNKQLELAKVLLSNETTQLGGIQRAGTDLRPFEVERDIQSVIHFKNDFKHHFNVFLKQKDNYYYTSVGSKNIGITASGGKQTASFTRHGLSLSRPFSIKHGDNNILVFSKFGKVDPKQYAAVEQEAYESKKQYLLDNGLTKDSSEYKAYVERMDSFLTTIRPSLFAGLNVAKATDQVKNNFSRPLNLSSNIISIDTLMIQLNIPYQIRTGITTHPIIRAISDLEGEGITNESDIISTLQNDGYDIADQENTILSKEENKQLRKDAKKTIEEYSDIKDLFTDHESMSDKINIYAQYLASITTDGEYSQEEALDISKIEYFYNTVLNDKPFEIPTAKELYEKDETNEAKVNRKIIDTYFYMINISRRLIKLNKLSGMTKGISNDIKDWSDYITLAAWIGLDTETVLKNVQHDTDYVNFINLLFDNLVQSKPPVEGLENIAKDPLIVNQLTSFFDFFLYGMFKLTSLGSIPVQRGITDLITSGVPMNADQVMMYTGLYYTTSMEAHFNPKQITIKSENNTNDKGVVSKSTTYTANTYLELSDNIDILIDAYKEQYDKTPFAKKLGYDDKSAISKVRPKMNNFASMNPETKNALMFDLWNESQNLVNRINFEINGQNYSISMKDFISLLFYTNGLRSGLIASNTSLSSVMPLTLLNKTTFPLDTRLILENKYNDVSNAVFMKTPKWLLKNMPYSVIPNKIFTGDHIVATKGDQKYPKFIKVGDKDRKYIKVAEYDDIVVYRKAVDIGTNQVDFISKSSILTLNQSKEPVILSPESSIGKSKKFLTTEDKLKIGDTFIIDDNTYVVNSKQRSFETNDGERRQGYKVVNISSLRTLQVDDTLLKKVAEDVKKHVRAYKLYQQDLKDYKKRKLKKEDAIDDTEKVEDTSKEAELDIEPIMPVHEISEDEVIELVYNYELEQDMATRDKLTRQDSIDFINKELGC